MPITVKVDDIDLTNLNWGTKVEAIAEIVKSEEGGYQAGLLEGAKQKVMQDNSVNAALAQSDAQAKYEANNQLNVVDTSLKTS